MTWFPRFADPEWLVLLLLIPWSAYVGWQIQSLGSGRKAFAVILRCVIVTLIVFALAGMELVKQNDKLAVFFILDHSDSVPEELRLASAQHVRNVCDQFMTSDDEAGVIVFGGEASIELNPAPSLGLREIRSVVDGQQTDLAAAVRLAMAAFPQGYMRRMVILSDGNETQGDALEEIKIAQAEGIAVDVVPVYTGDGPEVRVKEVSAPTQTKAGEPFQVRIVVHAEQAAEGTLQVYQRIGGERHMLQPKEVTLDPGDNVFLVTQELQGSGFYEYEAAIHTDNDTIPENNRGRAFTAIEGEPRVLYVSPDPSAGRYLVEALESEDIQVDQTTPFEMSASPAFLQNYDGVVLENVSATDLGANQLKLLESLVRDHGVGLAMVGGPDTFGAGGYLGTPVEKALPVSMDIKQRKIMPRGALALILHTCEIQNGNMWAREIALAALEVLASQDLMGTLGYMWDTNDSWIYKIQPVGDKTMMRKAIGKASTRIGDMPAVGPTLQMAYNGLKNADAAAKRIVIISDGDPAAPGQPLVDNLKAAKIAVSTVCIAPHSASDQNMLRWLARQTGGRYYFVNNANNLPQIFSKEAAVVKRGVLREEPFVPAVSHRSELLFGLLGEPLPQLKGYVVTTPKENATIPLVSDKGDPVLAHWRYGIGKAVAFTSDATNRWAADWVGWQGFNRFWAQTVRWALRERSESGFDIETRVEGNRGYIRVDAVDDQGRFVNFLDPKATITTPDFDTNQVELSQTAPGIYEGSFPVTDSGVYLANLAYAQGDGGSGMIPTGVAVDYSAEYRYSTPNIPLLERIASVGNGHLLGTQPENVFQHNLQASAVITPIWPWLAIAAACLFPFEIFIRRVVVPIGIVWVWILRMLRRIGALRRFLPEPPRRPMPVTGRYEAVTHDFGEAEGAPSSFGAVREPPPETPTAATAETPTTQEEKRQPAGHSSYTQQLLAAKERARKQQEKDK